MFDKIQNIILCIEDSIKHLSELELEIEELSSADMKMALNSSRGTDGIMTLSLGEELRSLLSGTL